MISTPQARPLMMVLSMHCNMLSLVLRISSPSPPETNSEI